MPKKILVFMIANTSKAFDNFFEKICVIIKTEIKNAKNICIVNALNAEVIIKNQNENPKVTARDLNLGEENSILNWINKSYQATL